MFRKTRMLVLFWLWSTGLHVLRADRSSSNDDPVEEMETANVTCPEKVEARKKFERFKNIGSLVDFVKDIDDKIVSFTDELEKIDEKMLYFTNDLFDEIGKKTATFSEDDLWARKEMTGECLDVATNMTNLAAKKETFASSETPGNYYARNMVDGNFGTRFASKKDETEPYIGLDLGRKRRIYFMIMYIIKGTYHHCTNLKFYVGNTKVGTNRDFSDAVLFTSFEGPATQDVNYLRQTTGLPYIEGQFIYITKETNINHLDLNELYVMGI